MCTVLLPSDDNPIAVNRYIKYQNTLLIRRWVLRDGEFCASYSNYGAANILVKVRGLRLAQRHIMEALYTEVILIKDNQEIDYSQ